MTHFDIKPTTANIRVFASPLAVGEAAALEVAAELRTLLAGQHSVRMILAAAPSQSAMLRTLTKAEGIDWSRVTAFHMDEYVGLALDAPQRFGRWLHREFFARVPLGAIHLIFPDPDPSAASSEYAALLAEAPIDIVCLGIGMNGHLAFNDPPADFHEARDVRTVELDMESRMQQVNEGLFPAIDDVPTHAVTLSIPRLLKAGKLFCCVSGQMKNAAVLRAFRGEISPQSPASILRIQENCSVFLDEAAASGMKPGA
jgi:glucosamine-6-phosphate deaminase